MPLSDTCGVYLAETSKIKNAQVFFLGESVKDLLHVLRGSYSQFTCTHEAYSEIVSRRRMHMQVIQSSRIVSYVPDNKRK